MSDTKTFLCAHLIARNGEGAYAVFPPDNVHVEYHCPACYADAAEKVVAKSTYGHAANCTHVEPEHVSAVASACLKRGEERKRPNKMYRLGLELKRRFGKRRYGFDDGNGPSWTRKTYVRPIKEPTRLSSYAGVHHT